jgi:hypothetical protein
VETKKFKKLSVKKNGWNGGDQKRKVKVNIFFRENEKKKE